MRYAVALAEELRASVALLYITEDADFQRHIQRIAAEEPAGQPAAAAVNEPLPLETRVE